jgi:hypothetical protein
MYRSRFLVTDGDSHNTAVIFFDSVMMFTERTALQLPSPPDPGSPVAPKRPGSIEW